MGQYYIPTIIGENNGVKTLCSHEFNNGLKLTEHSWIGNSFVNAAISLINKNPQRVAWIGDYSDDPYEDKYSHKLPKDEFMKYYDAAWDEKNKCTVPASQFGEAEQSLVDENTTGTYFVDHTKKQYIDVSKYIANAKTDDGWCVNPLPILTACGNGRGGGDYRGVNSDKVGTWAFDLIEYTDEEPENYEEICTVFVDK